MIRRIVCDSSANLFNLKDTDFVSVPLKIITDDKEYLDDENLDIDAMIKDFENYKGKSSTSCPNIADWLNAYEGADEIFGVSLTSTLSGGYNAACMAGEEYMEKYPGKKVFILDSLTTGPELELIVEKYSELICLGTPFEQIVKEITEYSKRTHLMFILDSLQNFVNNGRVNPAIGVMVKALNINIVGQASDGGELEPLNKCRGRSHGVKQLLKNMAAAGFNGGKVRIRYALDKEVADTVANEIIKMYPDCDISIARSMGICSYYAEKNGFLIGFESC